MVQASPQQYSEQPEGVYAPQPTTPEQTYTEQEMQGYQSIQPEQIPQQMPQEPQKRPITTIFKSYGGSPYKPVTADQQPSYDDGVYYTDYDSFTGKQILKKRQQAEKWSTEGVQR
jgi:hypothetical protein